MAFDFGATRKQAETEGLIGGDRFKIKEGSNRVRLMSECLPHASMFEGKKNFKWLCYIIDRADDKLKVFFMPHKIYKGLEELQRTPDYEFFDVPMPYDVTITAKAAGTINVEYGLVPARKNIEVTPEEIAQLAAAKPLTELQRAMKDKAAETAAKSPAPVPAAVSAPPLRPDPHAGDLDDEIPF